MSVKSNPKPQRSQSRPQGRPGQSARVAKTRHASLEKMFPITQGTREGSGSKLVQPKYLHTKAQARSNPESADISDLAESIVEMRKNHLGIDETGILQALIVTPYEDYVNEEGQPERGHYWIVTGERRYRASIQAQIPEVPVVVMKSNDTLLSVVQLTENTQRKDISVLDHARAILLLHNNHGLSVRELAPLLGMSKSTVGRFLKLPRVGADVLDFLSRQRDSKGATLTHALLIDSVEPGPLRSRLLAAAERGESVQKLQDMINVATPKARPASTESDFSTSHTMADVQVSSQVQSAYPQPTYGQQAPTYGQQAPATGSAQVLSNNAVPGRPFDGGSVLNNINLDELGHNEIGTRALGTDTVNKYFRPAAQLLDQALESHNSGDAIPIVPEALAKALEPIEQKIAALRLAYAEKQARQAAEAEQENGEK